MSIALPTCNRSFNEPVNLFLKSFKCNVNDTTHFKDITWIDRFLTFLPSKFADHLSLFHGQTPQDRVMRLENLWLRLIYLSSLSRRGSAFIWGAHKCYWNVDKCTMHNIHESRSRESSELHWKVGKCFQYNYYYCTVISSFPTCWGPEKGLYGAEGPTQFLTFVAPVSNFFSD